MDKLFDDGSAVTAEHAAKEDDKLDRLKELDSKIAGAIAKVKSLKEENSMLENKVRELEGRLAEKDEEIRELTMEKTSIKDQISDLLDELESIETN